MEVVLSIFGRGGEGSKPPISFLRRAISFTPHCFFFLDTIKVARPFYLVYTSCPIERKGNIYIYIYRGLTNSRVGPLGNEINNQSYINWFTTCYYVFYF